MLMKGTVERRIDTTSSARWSKWMSVRRNNNKHQSMHVEESQMSSLCATAYLDFIQLLLSIGVAIEVDDVIDVCPVVARQLADWMQMFLS